MSLLKTDSISLKSKPRLYKKFFCFNKILVSVDGPSLKRFEKALFAASSQPPSLSNTSKIITSATPFDLSSLEILIGPNPFLFLKTTYDSENR